MTGAEVAARALKAYGAQWRYVLGAKPDPATVQPGAVGVAADCTGYVWWATGRAQVGRLAGNRLWRDSPVPVVGGAVWHDRRPPAKFGHAGVIIAVHPNGDFDTLDCSSTPPGPRAGAIRLLRNARAFWSRNNTASFGFWVPRYIETQSPGFGLVGALALAAVAAAVVLYVSSRDS